MNRTGWVTATAVALALTMVACDDDDDDGTGPEAERFSANLEVENEVPPVLVATDASGSASFEVQDGTVEYSIDVEDISGVTFAHIHHGADTVAGPFVVFLFRADSATGDVDGQLAEGSFTADSILPIGTDPAISLDSLLVLMRTGNAYVNVHTVVNPAGEIRGQIEPD